VNTIPFNIDKDEFSQIVDNSRPRSTTAKTNKGSNLYRFFLIHTIEGWNQRNQVYWPNIKLVLAIR
jgi:hypothetical protein